MHLDDMPSQSLQITLIIVNHTESIYICIYKYIYDSRCIMQCGGPRCTYILSTYILLYMYRYIYRYIHTLRRNVCGPHRDQRRRSCSRNTQPQPLLFIYSISRLWYKPTQRVKSLRNYNTSIICKSVNNRK